VIFPIMTPLSACALHNAFNLKQHQTDGPRSGMAGENFYLPEENLVARAPRIVKKS
jgi:hypothetical protein